MLASSNRRRFPEKASHIVDQVVGGVAGSSF
jgi:hypothetical protein